VFELYFWEERPPAEIAEELTMRLSRPISLVDVLDALDTIHGCLSDRHRSELLSSAMRARPPISLERDADEPLDIIDERAGPDEIFAARESAAAFDAALASLPADDAAIVRLRYVEALSLADVRRALHLPDLGEPRIRGILDRLRAQLAAVGGSDMAGARAGGEERR
jgi:DNA-directed RNA polymerase specialized sigma24 family protein